MKTHLPTAIIAFVLGLVVGMLAMPGNNAAELRTENAQLQRENELLQKLNGELLQEREEVRAVLEVNN